MPPSTPPTGTPQIRVSILGSFRVERDAEPVPEGAWQRRSGRTLLKLLAVTPEHRLHREQILDLLWPDLPPDNGALQLRKAVSFARRALDPDRATRHDDSCIRLVDEVVTLDPAQCVVDADQFEQRAAAALESRDAAALETALSLYGGEILPEDRYEEWAVPRREQLAALHREVRHALAEHFEQTGMASRALSICQQLLQEDPANETLYRRLMVLEVRAGSRHRALRYYQQCRSVLHDESGIEPSPETEQLHRQILAGEVAALQLRTIALPAVLRRATDIPLAGRQAELEVLQAEFVAAQRGAGRGILLCGEMGAGKSRLAAEFCRIAHRNGAVVLWGTASEQQAQIPYAPIVEALDAAIIDLSESDRAGLGRIDDELRALIPSLGVPEQVVHVAATGQQLRFFTAIVRLLDALTGKRSLVLVLDDVHTADAATLHLFAHLARAARSRRWLVTGTWRNDDATAARFQDFALALQRHQGGRLIELSRLDRDECRMLLASMVNNETISPELLDEIFTRTIGNALFAREIMQDLIDQQLIAWHDNAWHLTSFATIRVPTQIRHLVEARLTQLDQRVQDVVHLVAVAGSECSWTLLAAASPLEASELLDSLDLALESRMLEEHDRGYGFVHPVFRQVLIEHLPRGRRIGLHTALAHVIDQLPAGHLRKHPESIAALAHHWREAGKPERAIPRLIEAADHAARVYASSIAIDQLSTAQGLLQELEHGAEQAERWNADILVRLGDLHALAGAANDAWMNYCEALRTDALQVEETIRVQRLAARQAMSLNQLASAETHIGDALALATAGTFPAERSRLSVTAAQFQFMTNRFDRALQLAEEGVAFAQEANAADCLAEALEMVAMACLPLGYWERGFECERQRTALQDVHQVARDMFEVHFCFAEYHLYTSEPAAAARTFAETLTVAERMGASRSLAFCHYYLGVMAYFHGQFHEALVHEQRAIGVFRRLDSPMGEAIAHLIHGLGNTALGKLESGRDEMEAALLLAKRGPLDSHATLRLYAGLCRNRLDANDASGARHYADLGLNLASEPGTCICHASFLPGATAAHAVSGDLDQAAALGQRALQVATAFGSPAFRCMAQQANAMVAALAGEWQSAFDALDDARNLAVAHQFPYELTRTLHLRSFVHLQRRTPADLAAASRLMLQAMPVLVRLGVPASAAQMKSSLGFLQAQARRPA